MPLLSLSPKTPIPSHLHLHLHLHLLQRPPVPFQSPLKPPKLAVKQPHSLSNCNPFLYSPICRALDKPLPISPINPEQVGIENEKPNNNNNNNNNNNSKNKSFWAAVSLIVGTAVGPGMLGLPSATIKSGTIPSTIAIILSWVYVVSSIILVAELSFATMKDNNVDEVSFTSLATGAFGPDFGALVAIVYACLSLSLLIACVSGIGSLIVQRFRSVSPVVAHSLAPVSVAIVIAFFPFKAIDLTNRLLCSLMLFSITALVLIGSSVGLGRSGLLGSPSFTSWRLASIMPAIPVTVLTLGFHVITPFVCRIMGDSMYDARKAILFGGAVPLVMVFSWNAVVLGLAGGGKETFVQPIELLLSVNSSALPAVQGFAFAALATSLIGYAVSFPKQLVDTVRLIGERFARKDGSMESSNGSISLDDSSRWNGGALVTWLVLVIPIFIASFSPTAFSKALDFAGVYANCFLFGVLPPAMAWIHRTRRRYRSSTHREDLLPGGSLALAVLFIIAVILGFWH